MPICKKCGRKFSFYIRVDGKVRRTAGRKYCYDCSPFGEHNTRKLELKGFGTKDRKSCPKCGIVKSLTEFYKSKSRISSWCRDCLRDNQNRFWEKNKRKAVNYLGGRCKRCGFDENIVALSIHHIDSRGKEYNWNQLKRKNWENIKKELNKCVLLCLNCHIIFHTQDHSSNSVTPIKGIRECGLEQIDEARQAQINLLGAIMS